MSDSPIYTAADLAAIVWTLDLMAIEAHEDHRPETSLRLRRAQRIVQSHLRAALDDTPLACERDHCRWEARVKKLEARAHRVVDILEGKSDIVPAKRSVATWVGGDRFLPLMPAGSPIQPGPWAFNMHLTHGCAEMPKEGRYLFEDMGYAATWPPRFDWT